VAVYYVRPVNGNDGNDGLSFGAAFASTQKAANTALAGDEVRLCAEAVETPTATVNFTTNAGTRASRIRFVGCDASGIPLTSGHYTLDGSAIPAASLCNMDTPAAFLAFSYIRFTNSTETGFNLTQPTGFNAYTSFYRCRFDHNAQVGLGGTGARHGTFVICVDCEIDHNNQGFGHTNTNSSTGTIVLLGCRIHDNATFGARVNGTLFLTGNRIYRNGGIGARAGNFAHFSLFDTFYSNTGHNAEMGDRPAGNAYVGSGGYGLSIWANPAIPVTPNYNHYHGNQLGEHSIVPTPGYGNRNGDPLFVSVAEGAEDFRALGRSPLVGSGPGGVNIGAMGTAVAGFKGRGIRRGVGR
jgi:hypothetical protein